ncbi:MAG: PilZ domain-containing protein [Nitrospira sp.]|nr:MAG: PilZ domain-containing protein [Nitrospira sp.]
MKRTSITSRRGLQPMVEAVNRRHDSRPSVEFGLMYSAQEPTGEVFMGDGMVTDLSPTGLGIRGNTFVSPGEELTIFLYLPDGQDPLFVMEAKVAWASGHRFGVEILKMNLREHNRLRYFLRANAAHFD